MTDAYSSLLLTNDAYISFRVLISVKLPPVPDTITKYFGSGRNNCVYVTGKTKSGIECQLAAHLLLDIQKNGNRHQTL